MELFETASIYPEGFLYFPGFLTKDEERELLDTVMSMRLHTFVFHGYEAKRKVASFGVDYSFEQRKLSAGVDIPEVFNPLIIKVAGASNVEPSEIKELLVTEYPPGAVINWHRDAFPFEVVMGISLLSSCRFRLRPFDKTKQHRKATVSLSIEPRSLYVMRGAARWDWEHSTSPVEEVRYSITLRTLRK